MKNKIIKKIKEGASFKSKVFDLFRNDKEVIFEALKVDSRAFQYASHELKDDPDFVKEVITRTHDSFNLAKEALKANGQNYYEISKHLKMDRELLLAAIESKIPFPWVLKCASDEIKSDKEFVLKFLKMEGRVVVHASDEIKAICQGLDPAEALEKAINAEKLSTDLQKSLANSQSNKKAKLKI